MCVIFTRYSTTLQETELTAFIQGNNMPTVYVDHGSIAVQNVGWWLTHAVCELCFEEYNCPTKDAETFANSFSKTKEIATAAVEFGMAEFLRHLEWDLERVLDFIVDQGLFYSFVARCWSEVHSPNIEIWARNTIVYAAAKHHSTLILDEDYYNLPLTLRTEVSFYLRPNQAMMVRWHGPGVYEAN